MKIASYCRVSTDQKDQLNSFESQKQFFKNYIVHHTDWELYRIYADEGISGTTTKDRIQFCNMLDDARQGKFQLILTKEVSRFSRNILDTIQYTRELRSLGIGVIFLVDGINTLDTDSELRLSIMGSIAQEESRRTSARVKWGQTRQMERGVVFGSSLLGYDVENGNIRINREGAKIVFRIFYEYGIEKKGTTQIASDLQKDGVRTFRGNSSWNPGQILKILKNEKYAGNLVQKKTFTIDYLSHNRKINTGEEEKIVIHNHHPGIVSEDLWNAVQNEIKKRSTAFSLSAAPSTKYAFSGKIQCGNCGCNFVMRKRKKPDGSDYKYWKCYGTVKKRDNTYGPNTVSKGCEKGLRNDTAMKIMQMIVSGLPIDIHWIMNNLSYIITAAIAENDTQVNKETANIKKKIEQTAERKARLVDLYLSGAITEKEMIDMKERYDGSQQKYIHKIKENIQIKTNENTIKIKLNKIENMVLSIITGEFQNETLYKIILDKMVVYSGKQIEATLNYLPLKWTFGQE